MARVHASAPGKIVLAGDYAVLEGAPALVMALDRRAGVTLDAASDGRLCVDAPDLGITAASAVLCEGRLQWSGVATDSVQQLGLVTVVLEGLAEAGIVPEACAVRLDTSAFFAAAGQGKLGLGSSAALTVALAAAWCRWAGQPLPNLATLLALHRRLQGGRGSGVDVAASLHGGLIAYRLGERAPAARPMVWPASLAFVCVWSGHSASTGSALQRLAAWRAREGRAYAARMGELGVIAAAIESAFDVGNVAAVLDNVRAYALALDRLGQASGIDIVCAEHRAMLALADACGVAYKSCGAGGGDVGIALAADRQRLQDFARQAAAAGFMVLDVGMDRRGVMSSADAAVTGEQVGFHACE